LSIKVSIVIPVFNRESLVARAINSCLDQSLDKKHFEVIVVNDGSTDKSKLEIKKFSKQIKYLEHETNLGLPNARNTAIRNALGRFVFNLDSDDYIHPKTIETMLLGMELGNFDALACDYYNTDIEDNKSAHMSAKENPIACGIIFKRQLLINIGLFDENLKIHEDKDLFIRFSKKYKITYLPYPFYRYYQHNESLSRSKDADEYLKKINKKNYDI
jgi:glycosyltransferase involved in cell wall biosynthesis